jgi:LysM repeat protein
MGRSAVMAESLSGYMDVVKERIITVRKTIESLQKPKFYAETISAFEKPMMEDVPSDVAENWIDQLTIRQFNEELKDVFPYIYNLVSEATKAKDITAEDILGEAPIDDVEVRAPAETYKVASGDTIYSIAKKFQNANFQGADIEEAVKEIMMLNNIADPKALQVGQVIEMPYFMGTGPDGSTRGMPGSFDKYGEEIENSFEDMMGQFAEAKEEMCPEACCGKPVTECKCGPDCEHCDCHEKNKMNEAKGKDHDDDGDIDSDDYMAAKDKAIKKAMGKDDDELEERKIPVSEFVLSLFDREQGTFPKGETAVLTAIEKDYGEQYIEPAKQFIERIQSTYEQYASPVQEPMIDEEPTGTVMEPTIEQDEEIGESGLQYYTGVKKHGKEYMDKAAKAGREGASQQELGALKDKYSKAEKKTEAQEIRELGDRLMKLAGL